MCSATTKMTTKSTETKKRKCAEPSVDEVSVYYSSTVAKWVGRSLDDLHLFLGHFDTEQKAKKAVLDYAKFYGGGETDLKSKQIKKGKNSI